MRNAGRRAPRLKWWSMLDLNQRPPACEAGALPTELIDRDEEYYVLAGTASTEREADVPENVPESLWATSCRLPGLTMGEGYSSPSQRCASSTVEKILMSSPL
jgi:hypothetical protein